MSRLMRKRLADLPSLTGRPEVVDLAKPGVIVHAAHDQIAVAVDGNVTWLSPAEVEKLRHQLMMASRQVRTNLAAQSVPQPRRG